MKLVVLLVALLCLLAKAEYFAFGEEAINQIFKEHRDAFILFSSPDDSYAINAFKESAAADQTNVYSVVDSEQNKDHFQRFAEYLGVKVDPTPSLIFFVGARRKYVVDASDLSPSAFSAFASKVAAGQIAPFLKSAPIPTEESGPVKTIVGNNFKQAILESDKEVLLKVYAPWCGHCKKIAPEFEAAAEALAHNKNIILADFDGTLNEVESIQIKGYPTIFWYGKDKSAEPITFNGGRDKNGIIDWIKDHTEYEWTEPQEAEAAEEQF